MVMGPGIPICMHKCLQMTVIVIPWTKASQLWLSLVVKIGPTNSLC